MRPIKLKLFSQSYPIDSLLARRLVQEQGYQYAELKKPFLFRGDTRSPDKIFEHGFYRRIEDNTVKNPVISAKRESYECIATSKDLCYAVGFADCPSGVYPKPSYAWVYLIYSKNGFDIGDGSSSDANDTNLARLVNEVTLTGIAPEQILAAFQIKTTKNGIVHYYNPRAFYYIEPSWHILITDFKLNPHCALKDTDPDLYKSAVDQFEINYERGYFYIPNAPVAEEIDYAHTHDMSHTQKWAFRTGFSREDVISNRVTTDHIILVEKGIADLHSVLELTYAELTGLQLGFSIEEVSGLNSLQIEGLRYGFSRDDVSSSWFTNEHLLAADEGVPLDLMRGKTEKEVHVLLFGENKDSADDFEATQNYLNNLFIQANVQEDSEGLNDDFSLQKKLK